MLRRDERAIRLLEPCRPDYARRARPDSGHVYIIVVLTSACPSWWAEPRISTDSGRREDKLPDPIARCMGIFSIERERQNNAAKAIGEITFVLPLHVHQMHAKRCLDPFRQHRPPILLSI